MIRLAQASDVPSVTEQMIQLQSRTAWAQFKEWGYNHASLSRFIHEKLSDPNAVLYVWDDGDDRVAAFCGGALNLFYLPPHMPLVFEWGWFGPPRQAAACWRAVKSWGKRRGARLAGRVRTQPGTSAHVADEHMIWKVLT